MAESGLFKNITVVAWVSRHAPLPAQIDWLHRHLGNVKIVFIRDTFRDAEDVYREVKARGARYAVVVLPLSMVDHLTRHDDIVWLYPVMETVHKGCPGPVSCELFNPDTDAFLPGGRRHVRFVTFKRIRGVRLILEDVPRPEELEAEPG